MLKEGSITVSYDIDVKANTGWSFSGFFDHYVEVFLFWGDGVQWGLHGCECSSFKSVVHH